MDGNAERGARSGGKGNDMDQSGGASDSAIRLETELERTLFAAPEVQAGLAYGEPRPGHPEGRVGRHLADVLANVDRCYGGSALREKLRLIAIVHDSFKHEVDPHRPKTGENHHAMRARRFAEKFIDDTAVLDVIELHDEAYNAWQMGRRDCDWKRAEFRARALLERLGDNLPLYLAFYHCDNMTGDKSQEPLEWFRRIASSRAEGSVSLGGDGSV